MGRESDNARDKASKVRGLTGLIHKEIGGYLYTVDTLEDELARMARYVWYLERYSVSIVAANKTNKPRSDVNVLALRRSYGVEEVIERMEKENG